MEFQQIFITFTIILIGTVGFITLLNYNNNAYGVQLISPDLQNSSNSIITATNNTILSLSIQSANSTITGNGGQSTSGTSQSTLLVTRGLNTITLLPQLLVLAPTVITSGASAIGIPQSYANLGIAVFFFGFAILMAYMLIVGVRRIL
jgi:hypothetical protein